MVDFPTENTYHYYCQIITTTATSVFSPAFAHPPVSFDFPRNVRTFACIGGFGPPWYIWGWRARRDRGMILVWRRQRCWHDFLKKWKQYWPRMGWGPHFCQYLKDCLPFEEIVGLRVLHFEKLGWLGNWMLLVWRCQLFEYCRILHFSRFHLPFLQYFQHFRLFPTDFTYQFSNHHLIDLKFLRLGFAPGFLQMMMVESCRCLSSLIGTLGRWAYYHHISITYYFLLTSAEFIWDFLFVILCVW